MASINFHNKMTDFRMEPGASFEFQALNHKSSVLQPFCPTSCFEPPDELSVL